MELFFSSPAEECSSPYHWTKDMKDFYNDDALKSMFVLSKIKRKMATLPKLWEVSSRDLTPVKGKRIRCSNCLHFGHVARECMESPKKTTCHMCGSIGHLAEKCPSSKCLSCGRVNRTFTINCKACIFARSKECRRCHVMGHISKDCPDNWRRYHGTTDMESLRGSDECNKPKSTIWCCNCATLGHDMLNCTVSDNSDFPRVSGFVASYDDGMSTPLRPDGQKRQSAPNAAGRNKMSRYFDIGNESRPEDVKPTPEPLMKQIINITPKESKKMKKLMKRKQKQKEILRRNAFNGQDRRGHYAKPYRR